MSSVLLLVTSLCLLLLVPLHPAPLPYGRQRKDWQCCNAGFSPATLNACLDRNDGNRVLSSKTAVVTMANAGTGAFSIPDISNFSVYQRAIMTSYASVRSYRFKAYNSTDGFDFQGTADSRWYKIKVLLDSISDGGWAADTDQILWIDADAIVLDFEFAPEELLRLHPQADVLASADVRMGLINTGVVLVRNTEWSRRFLSQWWYGPEASGDSAYQQQLQWRSQCDQDAFDRLYAYLLNRPASGTVPSEPRVSAKVKVLDMDAMNSRPPAMLHQQPHNPVLHLMGETTAMRERAFRHAWSVGVCGDGGAEPPLPQLGLNRSTLQRIAREVYGAEVDQLLAVAGTDWPPVLIAALPGSEEEWAAEERRLEDTLVAPLERLSRAAHHLCDLLHHLALSLSLQGDSQAAELKEEELWLRRRIFEMVTARIAEFKRAAAVGVESLSSPTANTTAIARLRGLLTGTLAQLLKRAAEAGNDLFGASADVNAKLKTANSVLAVLQELLGLVDASSRHVPLHMRALMYQSLGTLEHRLATEVGEVTSDTTRSAHLQRAQSHLQDSVASFAERQRCVAGDHSLALDSSALMETSYSLQLLAGVTCELRRFDEGVALWQRAVEQARDALLGLEQGLRYGNLAAALYNAAVCHLAAGRGAEAEVLAREALDTAVQGASRGGDSSRHDAVIAAADALLRDLSPSSQQSAEKESTAKTVARKVARAGADGTYFVRNQESSGVPQQGSAEEDEEWVECDLDEACELFEVQDQHQNRATDTEGDAADVLAGLDLEDMSPDEVEELRETRLRYYRQTRQSAEEELVAPRTSDTQGQGAVLMEPIPRESSISNRARRAAMESLEARVAGLEARQRELAAEVAALRMQLAALQHPPASGLN